MSFKRKTIRLPAENYRGKRLFFVTLCCDGCHIALEESSGAEWLIGHLSTNAAEHDFAVHAYCVMPDHLHLLVEGMNDGCELRRFISSFKQRTAFWYWQRFRTSLWQPRFYDHVLRKPEDIEAVAWYIWMNPVRKGICSAPQDYPLSGSFTLDWRKRCSPASAWSPPWKC